MVEGLFLVGTLFNDPQNYPIRKQRYPNYLDATSNGAVAIDPWLP